MLSVRQGMNVRVAIFQSVELPYSIEVPVSVPRAFLVKNVYEEAKRLYPMTLALQQFASLVMIYKERKIISQI